MSWLFFIVLIDSIGFGIILPLLPVFALKFELGAMHLGLLTAIFSFCQLITAPILGALSDRMGRKNILVICLIAIAGSYFILASATTFAVALIARVLAGMFTGNISVVLASVSDISSNNNRAKYMGIIGAGTGLGFMLGPIIGGFLAGNSVEHANLSLVFNIAGICTGTAGILAFIFFKETLDKTDKTQQSNFVALASITIKNIFNNQSAMFLIYLSIFMWFAFASINVFLTTWSVAKFNLSPFHLGVIGTTFAFLSATVQVISPHYISGKKAILLGFLMSGISTLALTLNPSMNMLIVIVVFLAMGLGFLFPNLNASLSFFGNKNEKGFILGLSQSASTLGQTIGPLVIGVCYNLFPINVSWLIIAVSFFLAGLLTIKHMLTASVINYKEL